MPDKETWFKDWFNSAYYHQLYFKRDTEEAALFIDKLIAHLKPLPESYILDVACGKGRHSILLAEKGFDVTGIDLSGESILEAKKNENELLHFFVHDMRLPFWINYFNYAFNFFTSFGYFHTIREHSNALRTIAQSLREGGVFVIDYLNVSYAEKHLEADDEIRLGNVNFKISKWFDEDRFYKKIVIEDEALGETFIHRERVAKFSLDNFTEMLSKQGMHVQEVFGDYDLGEYDVNNSPRMIIVAKKHL